MSSEVARLRALIEQNYIAARRGLYAYRETAKHEIITNAFAAIQNSFEELENVVGEEQAREVLIQVMEQQYSGQEQPPL